MKGKPILGRVEIEYIFIKSISFLDLLFSMVLDNSHDEKVELHSGRIVAWTVGVRFEQSNYCCFRFVTAVHGEGTVWIQNSRPRAVPSGI